MPRGIGQWPDPCGQARGVFRRGAKYSGAGGGASVYFKSKTSNLPLRLPGLSGADEGRGVIPRGQGWGEGLFQSGQSNNPASLERGIIFQGGQCND